MVLLPSVCVVVVVVIVVVVAGHTVCLAQADRENPLERHMQRMAELAGGFEKAPIAPWLFACAGRYHMEKYGTKAETFAKIAEKNHRHRCAGEMSKTFWIVLHAMCLC